MKLLIAAMPRSASTSIIRNLVAVTGLPECPPRKHERKGVPLNMWSDLFPEDWDEAPVSTVGKLHCRGNDINARILAKHGVKVIFQVRDIYDALVSLRDHHQGLWQRSVFGATWNRLTPAGQMDAVIRYYGPQYVQQYIGWCLFAPAVGLEPEMRTYADYVADPVGYLASALGRSGIAFDLANVKRVAGKAHNFNKGVAGRGRAEMTDGQCAEIAGLFEPFPGVDFTPMGGPSG